jgi:hypothetical protein
MKLFKYIEPAFTPSPHKGDEYGDVSFKSRVNGKEKQLKIIMKSCPNSKKNITAASKEGKEITNQLITQYFRDGNKPLLGILSTPQIDRGFKADIIIVVAVMGGQVFYIYEESLAGIIKIATGKGFNLSVIG